MTQMLRDGAVLHVRFKGQSHDVALHLLDVAPDSDDEGIKRALARHLEVAPLELRDHVVDRHPTGNLTLRPEAVFG